jgi:hypothetical protein
MNAPAPIPGTWADKVKPHADRMILGGKLGCEVVLKPDAAAAMGEMIVNLARCLDATEARADAAHKVIAILTAPQPKVSKRFALGRDGWIVIAWIAAIVFACGLFQ